MLKKFQNLYKNKTFKEIVWSFLTKGSTLILFLVINIILARRLGVESFGLWSLFLSVMTIIFALSYFGVNTSTKKFVAQHNKTNNLKNVLLSSIKLRLIFSSIFSLLLLIFYKPLSSLINPELEILFLYGIPLIFLSGFVEYFKSVFMGLHRIKYNFIVNLSEYGLKFVLIILFLLFSNSVISVVNSFIIALFITMTIGSYLLYHNFYKSLKKTSNNFTKDILKYSYPLIFITIGFMALTEIDIIMIGIFSTVTEVGIYSVAKQIILKLPHISLAIAMGTMPVFAKLDNMNRSELKKRLHNLLKINSIIYFVIILGILFLSPFFIPLIFGLEYANSVLPLQILCIYLFFYATSIILSSFLDYTGKAKIRAYNICITIVLNIVLNVILIPKYGAVGAAIATTISYMPYIVLNWIEVRRSFD
jgi:O-antigen/teichoic acid export membrane protein